MITRRPRREVSTLITTGPAAEATLSDDDENLCSRAHGLMIAMRNDLLESTRQLLTPRITLNISFMILRLCTMCEEPLMPAHLNFLKASARDLIRRIGNEGRIPRSSASGREVRSCQADGNQPIGRW
jgi:hypothetical protein